MDLSEVELTAPQDYLDRTGIVDDFLPRLVELYLLQSAAVASRPAFDIAVLLGLFELRREPADPSRFQVAHLRHIVHWDRLETMVTDAVRPPARRIRLGHTGIRRHQHWS